MQASQQKMNIPSDQQSQVRGKDPVFRQRRAWRSGHPVSGVLGPQRADHLQEAAKTPLHPSRGIGSPAGVPASRHSLVGKRPHSPYKI